MPRVEPPAGGHVNVEAVASAVRSKDSRVRVAVAEVAVAVSVAVAVAVRISVEADVTRLLCELKVEISLRQHPRPPGTPDLRCGRVLVSELRPTYPASSASSRSRSASVSTRARPGRLVGGAAVCDI